jgi:hypothetical protein
MNQTAIFFLIILILWGAQPAGAIETDVQRLETRLAEKTSELRQAAVRHAQLTEQANALAPKISSLKTNHELNYFQRRQLEDYLKASQELSNELENLNRRIIQVRNEAQAIREELVAVYDQQIDQILRESDFTGLDRTRKKNLLKQLTHIKQQRNTLQTQMDWELADSFKMNQVEIHENDTPRKIQVKADWLKDLEQRLRTNVAKIERVVLNLKEEIELRDKMQEFEQELSLFNHRDETRAAPVVAAASEIEITFERNEPPIGGSKSTSGVSGSTALLPLFPNFIHENDVVNLSRADIQAYIDSLSRRKIELLVTADSLHKKASDFYQQAEQAKNPKHQGNK